MLNLIKPTTKELEILHVLWELGSGTVPIIHERIKAQQNTKYTTTLKLLQIMHQKGLVLRKESKRPHIYNPKWNKRTMQKFLLSEFITKVYKDKTCWVFRDLDSLS